MILFNLINNISLSNSVIKHSGGTSLYELFYFAVGQKTMIYPISRNLYNIYVIIVDLPEKDTPNKVHILLRIDDISNSFIDNPYIYTRYYIYPIL